MRRHIHLSPEDWLLIGYIIGLVVWWISDALRDEDDGGARSWTEQQATLTEDHLARLESGERVSIPRWHGGELVLDGTMVITAGEVADDE